MLWPIITLIAWLTGAIIASLAYTYWAERHDDGVDIEIAILVGVAWLIVVPMLIVALPSIWLSRRMNRNK